MLRTFSLSWKFWNTYMVNRIIYMIFSMPILRNINGNWYSKKIVIGFANVIRALRELLRMFYVKFFYILSLITVCRMFQSNQVEVFLHMIVFLTVIGAFLNTYMFNIEKEKYYALMVMHMKSCDYVKSNYYYNLVKLIGGLGLVLAILGGRIDLPFYLVFVIPFFVGALKVMVAYLHIRKYQLTGVVRAENNQGVGGWFVVGVMFLVGCILLYFKIVVSLKLFMVLFSGAILVGLYSLVKIHNFGDYKGMYKEIFASFDGQVLEDEDGNTRFRKFVARRIESNGQFQSRKEGYQYYHDLFLERHRRVFLRLVRRQVTLIVGFFSVVIILIFLFPNIKIVVNELLLFTFPYMVFVMYFFNLGGVMTETMFMNSDYSLLTYRVMRRPKAIISLFKERLKMVVSYNARLAFFIGLGLELLLLLSGGSNNSWNYIILFGGVMAMSVIFSGHYLVMYYLWQPYNQKSEMKSISYKIVYGVTYLVCFYVSTWRFQTMSFGLLMIIFSIGYILVSLALVRWLAPKTFKIR